jgi:hypothetical protein
MFSTIARVFLAGTLLFVTGTRAQDTRGRVQGLVTDNTQAVIAGASVTLRNENTGVQAQQQTNQTGTYLFDYVLPGDYTITVEMTGFKQFVQRNVLVQARSDVTVNANLDVGNTRETITVEASPVAVQFNSTTMALTLDTKMANSLPVINRNPFLLVSLNPAVVVNSTNEQSPYHHWAANQFDVGGNTDRKNDIILDGAPSMTTQKSSYTPPMDAVQEVNIQQNAVDAEFGHSSGGIISMQMKSGTNEFHGTAYYLGRNPALNALADRITRGKNLTRQNVWGLTQGNPILKNKLFNFFAYEGWRTIEPKSVLYTMPTDLERAGDFSRSLNTQGNLRTIYDPFTTQTSGNTVTRQPFAGNVVPAARFDPTSKIILGDIWKPNGPGSGPTNVNNFLAGYANRFRYYNLMDRVDYNITDKLKLFGRFNKFKTFTKWDDFTGGAVSQPVDGSKRHALNFSGDMVYAINASTVVNIRGAYNAIVDSFGVPEATLKPTDLERFWPGNAWYRGYLRSSRHLLPRDHGARRVHDDARQDRLLVPGTQLLQYRVQDVEEHRKALCEGRRRVSKRARRRVASATDELRLPPRPHVQHLSQPQYRLERRCLGELSVGRAGSELDDQFYPHPAPAGELHGPVLPGRFQTKHADHVEPRGAL